MFPIVDTSDKLTILTNTSILRMEFNGSNEQLVTYSGQYTLLHEQLCICVYIQ